ncbi:hypothetical protein AURDEDRAFT_116773 [Auricularia subglabra TFB-10046 SS5]|nr:hypothetical protein AURDEDRAFT_116773 [Auricularia subglabra TFB-10046 SS5]
MLECPLPEGSKEGTEAQPLAVPEVSGAAMSHILEMLYTPWGSEEIKLDADAYVDILKAAHRLQFERIWKIAHKSLSQNLRAVKKLHLALSHCGVEPWAAAAFRELVADPLSATPDDQHALSENIWHAIWKTRSEILDGRRNVEVRLLLYRALDGDQSPRICDDHLLDLLTSWKNVPLFPSSNKAHMAAAINACKGCPSCATRGSAFRPSLGELVHNCLNSERAAVDKAWNALVDV